jgi:nucleoside-diphosphate-sugar epimerase
MKVLVTGGTGVVAWQLVADLQRRSVQVRVVTRKAPERSAQPSEAEFFVGNMLDPHSMRGASKASTSYSS